MIVDRLSTKLGDYQQRFQRPEQEFEAQLIDSIVRDPEHKEEGTKLDQIQHLLSGHLLGPLVTEYET